MKTLICINPEKTWKLFEEDDYFILEVDGKEVERGNSAYYKDSVDRRFHYILENCDPDGNIEEDGED
jgi:hypothetical protein